MGTIFHFRLSSYLASPDMSGTCCYRHSSLASKFAATVVTVAVGRLSAASTDRHRSAFIIVTVRGRCVSRAGPRGRDSSTCFSLLMAVSVGVADLPSSSSC